MNKIKILAVAMASLASTSFAAGDLWNFATLLEKENCGKFCGQVHTPGAIYCWNQTEQTEANGYGRPCFDGTGGWWFGYADEGGAIKDAVSSKDVFVPKGVTDCNTDPKPSEARAPTIEKYIEPAEGSKTGQRTEWITNTVAGTVSKAGHYYIKGYGTGDGTEGLDFKLVNPAGTDENPSLSGFGFNWRGKKECEHDDFEKAYVENIGSKGTGLCIVYKADKAGVDVELGWNESLYEYNTWVAKLPAAASGWKTLNIKWDVFSFSWEGEEAPFPLETALTQAEALKFVFKNKTTTPETIRFQLKELGWRGSCSGTAEELPPCENCGSGNPNPIIGGKIASGYGFNLKDRTLTANFAGPVIIVNLQGKVVAKKILAANESMNLSNLPVGIYMVRSGSTKIVQKIMVK